MLSFIDITSRKAAEDELIQDREYAESIVDTVREPLLILDRDLTVVSASGSFYRVFQMSPKDTAGMNLIELNERQWDISNLISLLHTVISEGTSFRDSPITIDFPKVGTKKFILNARGLKRKNNNPNLILLAMEEVIEKNTMV